jgi:hypothetical protein
MVFGMGLEDYARPQPHGLPDIDIGGLSIGVRQAALAPHPARNLEAIEQVAVIGMLVDGGRVLDAVSCAMVRRMKTKLLIALTLVACGGSDDTPPQQAKSFAVAKAQCGIGDTQETGLQGQVPLPAQVGGFKGFNQKSVSVVITATDPRKNHFAHAPAPVAA